MFFHAQRRRLPLTETAILSSITIEQVNEAMPKPTKFELQQALKEATWMREKEQDPSHLAKCLLSHNYRIKFLENVMDCAKHYLHSGLAAHEHVELMKAIEAAEVASRELEEGKIDFGLDPGE
jgi:hypothetical protein